MPGTIKFRAWHPQYGMCPVSLMTWPDTPGLKERLEVIHNNIFQDIGEDKGVIIMQFTGLKDRDGTEIYTGDVMGDFPYYTPSYRYVIEDLRSFFWAMFDDQMLLNFEKALVVGNIHENPELRKEDH